MIELYGFDTEPFATVLWLEDGVARYKTVCYSDEEVKQAIELADLKGHFHYKRDYRIVSHRPIKSEYSKTCKVG